MKPRDTFSTRKEQFHQVLLKNQKQSKQLAWLRVILFVLFVVGFVLAADAGNAVGLLGSLIIFILLYFILLKKHQQVKKQVKLCENLKQVNQGEIKRLDYDLKEFDTGQRFFDPEHPYHIDLDIFGRHSLFQLVNRCSSLFGAPKLAQWLSEHAAKTMILKRQEALQELEKQIDFRQNFEAYGKLESAEEAKENISGFFAWLKTDYQVKKEWIYLALMLIFGAATATSIILAGLSIVPTGLPLLLIFINIGLLGTVFQKLLKITQQTSSGYKALNSLKEQLLLLEGQEFSASTLQEIKSQIQPEGKKASKVIEELAAILNNLQNRTNVMYVLLNLVFLLDFYWFIKIIRWKNLHDDDLESWFDRIAELDALVSLAGYAYAHKNYAYPDISDEPHLIQAQNLGHPLIASNKRVSNDFDFKERGSICLITGSNMSGKSTFLRTVGLNAVLALCGAPVCAERMTIGSLKVFTSMRTQDDLEESVSSFYAELKRLKQLLGQLSADRPTLFMIDEVLKGTNSDDRHKGAIALIRQLNQANAFGLVSTHDIVLGNITNELKGVKNYSFNSDIVGDEIRFNYQLTPGICESFNATKLMQLMGIDVE